jgi:capsular polysaccharide biosynthesis protein
MSFVYFLKLLYKNLLWLLVIPVALAVSIFYFTRNEVKVYSSESTIYTGIASGYSLSGNNKADFFATSNAFDNLLSLINSRETKEEVAINLLAKHLQLQKHDPAVLSWKSYEELKELVPDSVRQKVVKPTLDSTIASLKNFMVGVEGNLIYSIISNSTNPFYSITSIDNIKAIRINSSDLIKISYSTNDAVICKETLELLEECFMRKHRLLKEGQSESVVAYFETESKNAFNRLNEAEQSFLQFNKENDIINYYEQTKAVAIEKENLDVQKHNMKMDNMANSKSLDLVNDNIKGRLYQNEYGMAILREREQLSNVYTKMATDNLIGKNDPGYARRTDSLQRIANGLEKKLERSVGNLYSETLTPNGIPTKNVLDEWLKSSIQVEQSKARLTVMDQRRSEFEGQYKKYAPLGATLKKIERQINVSEQEYLELLHGLNTAKLTQQNNELTTKLNVVDEPYLPLKANPSKRMVQVIVGFIVGLVLVMAVTLARALIDKTVQHPAKAYKSIGLPLLGVFPLLNTPPAFVAKARLRLIQHVLAKINPAKMPITIGILSIQANEGKTTIVDTLFEELTEVGYKVKKQKWTREVAETESDAEIIITEFPPVENLVVRPGMIPKMDHTYLICRANRVWGALDSDLLKVFTSTTGNSPSLILNGIKSDFAEDFVGEVPKKRFLLRTFFKRVFRFQFGNRKKIIA